MSRAIETEDVQGIVLHGYARMRGAAFLVCAVRSPAAFGAWLDRSLRAGEVTSAGSPPEGRAMNIAFTSLGLHRLGVPHEATGGFSREFLEGMAPRPEGARGPGWIPDVPRDALTHRSRILGDEGPSDPETWRWGGPRNPSIDVLLMIYAATPEEAERRAASIDAESPKIGLEVLHRLETRPLEHERRFFEHFGFRDGISQPAIRGHRDRGEPPANTVAPGEFVLGYPDESGGFPRTPRVRDGGDLLPGGDFGRNGSYLVMRQLEQDVSGFWSALDRFARDESDRERLAAKMVGRWPDGASLVETPVRRPDARAGNDFGYRELDPFGWSCPFGAHVRRSNPRDMLGPDPKLAIRSANRHRLLRRGRTYGVPVAWPPDARAWARAALLEEAPRERGLHFLCFNASLRRQFEFVQQSWVQSPKFAGLHAEDDPIAGARSPGGGEFTIPGPPVRRRLTDLPAFVTVRGGDYFFAPGLRALAYLGTLFV